MLSNPLYIAEKPKMGAEIAKNLPGPYTRGEGYIQTGAGIVTWAIGHLLGQATPEDYDPKYKNWVYSDLPIIPATWKIEISSGKGKQMQVIKSLLKNCSDVVNAGDPGREGQLIVDEILEFFGNKKPVWRLLLNSLDGATVKKALANLLPNSQFVPLYQAALGRQRADWLVGMNLTRAYTLLGRKHGYDGVLSVGRVQTPTLAIVVRREEEIEAFVPQKYWTLRCQIGSTPMFWAKYVAPAIYSADPPTPRPSWLDDTLRVCEATKAAQIIQSVPAGTPAKVVAYATTPAQELPPLPFELADIQSRMNSQHGASVQDVLEACQSLYESGFASYPRTDCSYLPTSQLPEVPGILQSVAKALPALSGLVAQADTTLISRAWDDAKLGEHHAIIPTSVAPTVASLSPLEQHVYDAICRRYLAQFFPPCEVDKTALELEAGGHRWAARGRVIKQMGWRAVYGATQADAGETDDAAEAGDDADDTSVLPQLKVGDVHPVKQAEQTEQTTKPPPRYSEGTLMQAMKHVDRLVTDPAEKKMLKTVKGIGQAATRANIISTLIKRQYFEVRKKQLHPTGTARMLVNAVDKALIDPGLTARWEHALDGVAAGSIPLAAFQQKQEGWIQALITQAANTPMPPPPAGSVKPSGYAGGTGKSASASSGKKFPAKSGAGKTSAAGKGAAKSTAGAGGAAGSKVCPKCGQPMRERSVKQGPKAGQTFWGCSGYPACTHSEWPK